MFFEWNLFAYGVPLAAAYKTLGLCNPESYRKYEKSEESPLASLVREIVERSLSCASEWGGTDYPEMVQDLLDASDKKDVKAFIPHRFKVTSAGTEENPISVVGTDADRGSSIGRFFINIAPKIDDTTRAALPWIISHEVCHILETDWFEIGMCKTIASLFVSTVAVFWLQWTLIPSVLVAMTANVVTHIALSHRAEHRADAFANRVCTPDERNAGSEFLKASQLINEKAGFWGTVVRFISHPSEASRIANIETWHQELKSELAH